ncbi:MAG TPA: hypothetical protein PK497_03540 [Burkholderiaceae bacterium]|nr:hypothetical protein [Burkholderiaceae bacterium]
MLKSVAQSSQPMVATFTMWTPAKLICAVLVLAVHWSILSLIAHRLKEPLITAQTAQTDLRVRWISPTLGTVQIISADSFSAALLSPKKNPERNTSVREVTPANDANNPPLKQMSVVPETDQGWNPLNYRTSQEVDTRAIPVIDWMINHESAPGKSFATVIVTVWVSAAGVIDHFQIESQEPAGDWTSGALYSLPTTLMEPATLGGEPVASTMTVEISLDNTNNEPGTN